MTGESGNSPLCIDAAIKGGRQEAHDESLLHSENSALKLAFVSDPAILLCGAPPRPLQRAPPGVMRGFEHRVVKLGEGDLIEAHASTGDSHLSGRPWSQLDDSFD